MLRPIYLFLLLLSFSYSVEPLNSCSCPVDTYQTNFSESTAGAFSYDQVLASPPQECSNPTEYLGKWYIGWEQYNDIGGGYYSKTVFNIECTPMPTCPDGQQFDVNTSTCVDIPTCPNPELEVYNETTGQCDCISGLPKVESSVDVYECPVIDCPISWNGKVLRQQNQTRDYCLASYPVHLYDVEYIADMGITCCYAHERSEPAQPIDPTCDAGYHLDIYDRCVEDSPVINDEPLCSDGQVWDNFSQTCTDDPSTLSTGGDEGGSSSDGNDYNTTSGDTPYDGGDNQATDDIVLEYNSEEVNDMLNNYSSEISDKFKSSISDMQNSVLTFYEINIPLSPSCGCSDIPIDVTLLGTQYTETVEICSNLDTLFNTIRPLLWFVFLIGNLFAFFRGGN